VGAVDGAKDVIGRLEYERVLFTIVGLHCVPLRILTKTLPVPKVPKVSITII